MKSTCGVFIINPDGHVLIAHPTNTPDTVWSIPKGMRDDGETSFNAAIREVFEETGIILPDDKSLYLRLPDAFYTKNKKRLVAFAIIHDNIDISILKCDSMVLPRPGREVVFPEIDRYMWVTPAELAGLVHHTQASHIDAVVDYFIENIPLLPN